MTRLQLKLARDLLREGASVQESSSDADRTFREYLEDGLQIRTEIAVSNAQNQDRVHVLERDLNHESHRPDPAELHFPRQTVEKLMRECAVDSAKLSTDVTVYISYWVEQNGRAIARAAGNVVDHEDRKRLLERDLNCAVSIFDCVGIVPHTIGVEHSSP